MKHKTGNKSSDLKRACRNSLICVAVTLLLALLFGKLIDAGLIRMELMQAAACAAAGLSALAGCIVTALNSQKKALLYALITGSIYFVLLLFVNVLLLKGELHALLPTLLSVVAAVLLGSLIGAGKRSRSLR